jgi:hypothetical protein
MSGNSRHLTWLGMQMLGQTNVTKAEISKTTPPPDLSKLTDEELEVYEQLHAKISSQSGDGGEST